MRGRGGIRVRKLIGTSLLALGCTLSPYVAAANFGEMSNEELMGVQPHELSAQERDQFRTEMGRRMQDMTQEERDAFRNEIQSRRAQGGGRSFGGQGGGRAGY